MGHFVFVSTFATEVILIRTISSADEIRAREKFFRMRRIINISLFMLAMTIILVPISFMARSTVMFKKVDRSYLDLIEKTKFIDMQVKFQWYNIVMNLCICLLMVSTICVATQALKRLFASTFSREI